MSTQETSQLLSLAQPLAECAAACWNCAEKAEVNGLDCWKHCRSCALLCETTYKWIITDAPHLNDLAKVNMETCQSCGDHCSKHENEHCQKCAEHCYKVVSSLKKLREMRGVRSGGTAAKIEKKIGHMAERAGAAVGVGKEE